MIKVEKPSKETLQSLAVDGWPIWTKDVSTFSLQYDSQEVAYILEGEVTVTPDNGKPVHFLEQGI